MWEAGAGVGEVIARRELWLGRNGSAIEAALTRPDGVSAQGVRGCARRGRAGTSPRARARRGSAASTGPGCG